MDVASELAEKILHIDERILSVALVDMRGNTVLSTSKYRFQNQFTVDNKQTDRTDHGLMIRAAYGMIDNCAKTFGKIQTFVSLHENTKIIVLPVTKFGLLLVVVVLPSASAEYLSSKVNSLLGEHSDLPDPMTTARSSPLER